MDKNKKQKVQQSQSYNQQMLKGFSKKLMFESFIMAGILALTLALSIGIIMAVIILVLSQTEVVHFTLGYVIAIGLIPVIGIPMTYFFYKRIYKMSTKNVAVRVDGMGMEQRMITLLELEGSDSFIAQKLKEDTEQKVAKIKPKDLKFKFPKWPFIMLGAVLILAVASVAVSSILPAIAGRRLQPTDHFELLAPTAQENEIDIILHRGNPNTANPDGGYNGRITWNADENANAGFIVQIVDSNNRRVFYRGANDPFFGQTLDLMSIEPALTLGAYYITVTALEYQHHGQSPPSEPFRFEIVNRVYFLAQNGFAPVETNAGYLSRYDRVVITPLQDFDYRFMVPGPPLSRPDGREIYSFAGWASIYNTNILSPAEIQEVVRNAPRGRPVQFRAMWDILEETVYFLSGNLVSQNTPWRGMPHLFEASDVPSGFALTPPAFHQFRGWILYGDAERIVLTPADIQGLVRHLFYRERRFIASWYPNHEHLETRITYLENLITFAAIGYYTENPISPLLRDSLRHVVNPLINYVRFGTQDRTFEERLAMINNMYDAIGILITERFATFGAFSAFNLREVTFDLFTGWVENHDDDILADIGFGAAGVFTGSPVYIANGAVTSMRAHIAALRQRILHHLLTYNPGDFYFIVNNDVSFVCDCEDAVVPCENGNILIEDVRPPNFTSGPSDDITFHEAAFRAAVFLRITDPRTRSRAIEAYPYFEVYEIPRVWTLQPGVLMQVPAPTDEDPDAYIYEYDYSAHEHHRTAIHSVLYTNLDIRPDHVVFTQEYLDLFPSVDGSDTIARIMWISHMAQLEANVYTYQAESVDEGWLYVFRPTMGEEGSGIYNYWCYFRNHFVFGEIIYGEPGVWLMFDAFGFGWVPYQSYRLFHHDRAHLPEEARFVRGWWRWPPGPDDMESTPYWDGSRRMSDDELLAYIAYHEFEPPVYETRFRYDEYGERIPVIETRVRYLQPGDDDYDPNIADQYEEYKVHAYIYETRVRYLQPGDAGYDPDIDDQYEEYEVRVYLYETYEYRIWTDRLEFIALWDWLPVPSIIPTEGDEDEDEDDPVYGTPLPPTYFPDPPGNYVMGDTPYEEVWAEAVRELENLLATGNLTEEQRRIIQAQLDLLRPVAP